jgi:hypothetical protein
MRVSHNRNLDNARLAQTARAHYPLRVPSIARIELIAFVRRATRRLRSFAAQFQTVQRETFAARLASFQTIDTNEVYTAQTAQTRAQISRVAAFKAFKAMRHYRADRETL